MTDSQPEQTGDRQPAHTRPVYQRPAAVVRLDANGRLAGSLPPAPELAEFWRSGGPFTVTGAGQFLAGTELRRFHALAVITVIRHI